LQVGKDISQTLCIYLPVI